MQFPWLYHLDFFHPHQHSPTTPCPELGGSDEKSSAMATHSLYDFSTHLELHFWKLEVTTTRFSLLIPGSTQLLVPQTGKLWPPCVVLHPPLKPLRNLYVPFRNYPRTQKKRGDNVLETSKTQNKVWGLGLLSVLRAHSWRGSGDRIGWVGIKPGSAAYKENSLPTILSLFPQPQNEFLPRIRWFGIRYIWNGLRKKKSWIQVDSNGRRGISRRRNGIDQSSRQLFGEDFYPC